MYLPTDVLLSAVNNISVKECNKISQYKDLEIKIEKMCLLKTTTIPVRIKKGTDKLINKIPDFFSFYEIQRIVLCRTAALFDKRKKKHPTETEKIECISQISLTQDLK